MKNLVSSLLAAISIMAFSGLATTTASAQCTVINNTGCNISLCLYNNALAAPFCIPVAPGVNLVAVPLPFVPNGVVSAGKNRYAFAGLPAPGCTPCISLPTPALVPPCCGIVCYDAATCTFTITACGPPCLP